MPKLVDTTIRLLSQEPLAGQLPTAEILRVAEILDGAGFACLEVSGGGVFDATVRRRVESPWERIRAIKARVSTPLGIALRGRFLVGSRPVSGDIVGRFVACAAENGIEVFRLHDPLNDVSNLREAGAAITNAGGAFHAGLVYSPGRTDETDTLVEGARKLPELGATRVIVNDPTGALLQLGESVGGQKNGRAARAQLFDDLVECLAQRRIETGRRLVEQEDLRFTEQCLRQAEALPHALGIRANSPIRGMGEADTIEQRCDHGPILPLQACIEGKRLLSGQRRVERHILRKVP